MNTGFSSHTIYDYEHEYAQFKKKIPSIIEV